MFLDVRIAGSILLRHGTRAGDDSAKGSQEHKQPVYTDHPPKALQVGADWGDPNLVSDIADYCALLQSIPCVGRFVMPQNP